MMAAGGKNYCSFLSSSGNLSSYYDRSSESENTILECRVCNEVYSLQGDKVPRLLFCGHTVCHQCLSRFPLHGSSLLCPFDRQPTTIGYSGVWDLKKNFALLELLEKLQCSKAAPSKNAFSEEMLKQEKQLAVPCDENEDHVAVLYCTVCSTNLCVDCAEMSHGTRTLARHKRVPLSEKPKEVPKCQFHPMHLVEFACLEESCQNCPLMCYICKDYGRHAKHKHTLLDMEAENVRSSIISAVHQSKSFAEEVLDWARRLGTVIQQIEGGIQVISGQGSPHTQQIHGTADKAREKIKRYFSELRETLNHQEVAAHTEVDTHIRERLCVLRQQQEDMAILLSQISAVCHQCETTLAQENSKVIIAKQEVKTLQETIQKQQQQFSELPEQLSLDPAIPITFTKDNRVHIGPKLEMRVVTLGLDDSGKTSILFKLKQNEFIQTIPTIGFNVETIEYKNLRFTIWDVGGQHKLRPLWKHYYLNTQAVIFVVDSSNRARLQEAHNELAKLVQEKQLKEASLLIFANKQDVESCVSIEDLTREFNLFKLCCNRSWHIQACDATSGYGLCDGLEWFSRQMVAAGPIDLA